jgi:hypothetical protein
MVLWVLWTLRMRSILQMGACFFSQLDWNMISTMFLLVSSGLSSDTVKFEPKIRELRTCFSVW